MEVTCVFILPNVTSLIVLCLVTKLTCLGVISRMMMANPPLPCVLEFLAEVSWSLRPALWTSGLQPQLGHAECGIQHSRSQSPAHRPVAALCCGWLCIACQGCDTFNFIAPKSTWLLTCADYEIGSVGNSQEIIWYLLRAWGFRG